MATFRNIGFFGHRANRLKEMGVSEEALAESIERALGAIQRTLADDQGSGLRILMGLADGSDRLAAESADRLGYIRQCITPGSLEAELEGAEETSAHSFREGAETILELDARGSEEGAVSPEAYRIQAEGILAHSDLVVAVWDGEAPRGFEGGTVRAVFQAAVQRVPVVWLNPKDRSLRMLRLGALNAHQLERLRRHTGELADPAYWVQVEEEDLPEAVVAVPGLSRQKPGKEGKGNSDC